MRKIVVLAFVIVMASCVNTKAFFDYDKKANFDSYKTFSFYQDIRSGLGKLDENRLKATLIEALQNRTYTKANDPDFKINFYVDTFTKENPNTIGVGIGAGGGNIGGGLSGGIPIGRAKLYLSVTIEFTDAKTDDLFWQAVVESPYSPVQSPDERKIYFQKIVEKALKEYPPK